MENLSYPVTIEALPSSEGGGYIAFAPDLPGCMSDGKTPAEALHNVEDAIREWLATAAELHRPIPEPSRYLKLG